MEQGNAGVDGDLTTDVSECILTPVSTATTPSKRSLSTAEVRREEILAAAMRVFPDRGFLATPTTAIADAAGISQAYLFRLFPTKLDLVLAVVAHSNGRVIEAMRSAAAAAKLSGEEPMPAMGRAYEELLEDRELLMTQLHAHAAAASMPEVAELSRATFKELSEIVRDATDCDDEELRRFFGQGMLMNVLASIRAAETGSEWARALNVCDEE